MRNRQKYNIEVLRQQSRKKSDCSEVHDQTDFKMSMKVNNMVVKQTVDVGTRLEK